jgi:LPXTG-site transpeptidase (sortase) family protein
MNFQLMRSKAAAVSSLAVVGVLLVLSVSCSRSSSKPGEGVVQERGTATVEATATATPEPPTPTPTPTPSDAAVARLVIKKIGVDAPISVKGVDRNGVMQDPNGPWDVAWYDFSAKPGWGGNAVFSGHVDYINVGPAVFWGLRSLTEGDEIRVRLADGTEYEYHVVSNVSYGAYNAPVADIVGPTQKESITLITCGGVWDARAREYSNRTVVRAERADAARTQRQ